MQCREVVKVVNYGSAEQIYQKVRYSKSAGFESLLLLRSVSENVRDQEDQHPKVA